MYALEKSREYTYGGGQEFPSKQVAEKHATYKKQAMIREIRQRIVRSEIDDDGKRLQVIITVDRE